MRQPFRRQQSVKVSGSTRPEPPTEIRPNNPNPRERDPRPGRFSIIGPFVKLPEAPAGKDQ